MHLTEFNPNFTYSLLNRSLQELRDLTPIIIGPVSRERVFSPKLIIFHCIELFKCAYKDNIYIEGQFHINVLILIISQRLRYLKQLLSHSS
jgi:hypothetical protein